MVLLGCSAETLSYYCYNQLSHNACFESTQKQDILDKEMTFLVLFLEGKKPSLIYSKEHWDNGVPQTQIPEMHASKSLLQGTLNLVRSNKTRNLEVAGVNKQQLALKYFFHS